MTALKWPFDSDSQPIITPLPDLRSFYVASATLPREFALPSCPLAAFHQGKLYRREKKQEMAKREMLCVHALHNFVTRSSFPVSEKQSGNTSAPPGEGIAHNKGKNVDLRSLG